MAKLIRKNKKKKGFTLIELVAVVAIIGILAALLVPKISSYIQDAKKTKVIDQARKVVMAVETVNVKEDAQIPESAKINEFTSSAGGAKQKVYKYLAGDSTETVDKLLPNLKVESMDIATCKKITEGKIDFKVDSSGKYAENA